jgi:hypothetical protein
MPYDLPLTAAEASSAVAIQRAIDQVAAAGGGTVILPALEVTLDRGLELRSGVVLQGQGAATILRKGPGRIYPLSGYHNYGMTDVPLLSAAGLQPGMTVSVHDDARRGFYSTFARITWVEGNWVGLDHGIEADYLADAHPRLTTAYPLVFGHRLRGAGLRSLHLEGNRADNEAPMDGCRGGSVYFAKCVDLEVADVTERDFHGEGLSFQMCRNVRILRCAFHENTGNGLHPGAGSTQVLFADCQGHRNQRAGFFFCVRANHITVRGCHFAGNDLGISIGTRDCYNLLDGCTVSGNRGPGIHARLSPAPTEVHSIEIRDCVVTGNGTARDAAQIELEDSAHDLIITRNRLAGQLGLRAVQQVHRVYLEDNDTSGCAIPSAIPADKLTATRPAFPAGYDQATPTAWRHLDGV